VGPNKNTREFGVFTSKAESNFRVYAYNFSYILPTRGQHVLFSISRVALLVSPSSPGHTTSPPPVLVEKSRLVYPFSTLFHSPILFDNLSYGARLERAVGELVGISLEDLCKGSKIS